MYPLEMLSDFSTKTLVLILSSSNFIDDFVDENLLFLALWKKNNNMQTKGQKYCLVTSILQRQLKVIHFITSLFFVLS